MQTAVEGAINAVVPWGQDYLKGATHWARNDIGSKAEKRATGELELTQASHEYAGIGKQDC